VAKSGGAAPTVFSATEKMLFATEKIFSEANKIFSAPEI
jgi:hypothetical protein